MMGLGMDSINALDEIRARENFRDLVKKEFNEKEKKMEEMCQLATRECVDRMRAQVCM